MRSLQISEVAVLKASTTSPNGKGDSASMSTMSFSGISVNISKADTRASSTVMKGPRMFVATDLDSSKKISKSLSSPSSMGHNTGAMRWPTTCFSHWGGSADASKAQQGIDTILGRATSHTLSHTTWRIMDHFFLFLFLDELFSLFSQQQQERTKTQVAPVLKVACPRNPGIYCARLLVNHGPGGGLAQPRLVVIQRLEPPPACLLATQLSGNCWSPARSAVAGTSVDDHAVLCHASPHRTLSFLVYVSCLSRMPKGAFAARLERSGLHAAIKTSRSPCSRSCGPRPHLPSESEKVSRDHGGVW